MFCSRYFVGRVAAAVVILTVLFVVGCGDDPENKASKELRASCERGRVIVSESRTKARQILRDSEESVKEADPAKAAIEISKGTAKAHQEIKDGFERAYSEVAGALGTHGRSASKQTQSVAALTAADIVFSEAQELNLLLVNYRIDAEMAFDEITLAVRQIDSFHGQKGVLEKLLAGVEQEASGLEDVLESGVAGSEGLRKLLASERARLSELLQGKEQLNQKMLQQQNIANEIESKASAMLKKAESLSNGNERLKLEKEAYGLRLSKKSHLSQYQSIVDSLALVESKMLISGQMVEKYAADVKKFSDKIAAIRSSSRQLDLERQLTQIDKQISQYHQKMGEFLGQLSQKRDTYNDSLEEIAALFEKAAVDYDRSAKSGKVRGFAAERVASSRLWLGAIYSDSVRFHEELLSRMRFVEDISAITGSGGLASMIRQCSQASADHREKTYGSFDLAVEGFGALADGGEFASTAVKSNILALYGKAELATYLGGVALTDNLREASYLISDKAMEEAGKLLPRAEECDPFFSKSITSWLLSGDIEFVPQMEVDLTSYYEDIRNRQFGDWPKLKGQEKVRQIEYLLDLIASMQPPKDPAAFGQIILPEKRLLEDALKAPFEEQQGSGGSDPNS
ncbi:MAG: hypothetical protein FVQ79_09745 [Planctomycetes bacterium]|nr:hypothetical protein [Planctomycetota bacterium]